MTVVAETSVIEAVEEVGKMEIGFLVIGAAVFYVMAMLLMKYWGALPPLAMAAMIGAAFVAGGFFELEALKIGRLSAVYMSILAIECLIVAIVSFGVIGESVTLREMAGGALVLTGLAIAAA